MSAQDKTYALMHRLASRGINATFSQAETLRRAELVLQRWAEQECGTGNDYASWAIERDEATGIPYRVTYPHQGKSRRYRIPDREAGALRRVKAVCKELGISWYHQTDPRGCMLYVAGELIQEHDYTRGVACSV